MCIRDSLKTADCKCHGIGQLSRVLYLESAFPVPVFQKDEQDAVGDERGSHHINIIHMFLKPVVKEHTDHACRYAAHYLSLIHI